MLCTLSGLLGFCRCPRDVRRAVSGLHVRGALDRAAGPSPARQLLVAFRGGAGGGGGGGGCLVLVLFLMVFLLRSALDWHFAGEQRKSVQTHLISSSLLSSLLFSSSPCLSSPLALITSSLVSFSATRRTLRHGLPSAPRWPAGRLAAGPARRSAGRWAVWSCWLRSWQPCGVCTTAAPFPSKSSYLSAF